MKRGLVSVLILFVLMVAIWTVTLMAARPGSSGALGLLQM